jgi:hypothetical protein
VTPNVMILSLLPLGRLLIIGNASRSGDLEKKLRPFLDIFFCDNFSGQIVHEVLMLCKGQPIRDHLDRSMDVSCTNRGKAKIQSPGESEYCSRHSKSTSTNDLTKYILSPAQGIIHDKIVTYHQVQSFGLG